MKVNESEMAQSSEYPDRPGIIDCQFYIKTGRCGYGENCCYNHPKDISEKINLPKCKYFLIGACKFGSSCVYDHSKERDGAEPMRQDQRRHEKESSSRPEKKANTIPDPREGDISERFEENLQEQREGDIEKQRGEDQDNMQEERLMPLKRCKRNRESDIERQRREARLRLEQIKQTVYFDEAIRIRELFAELGLELKEGSGRWILSVTRTPKRIL